MIYADERIDNLECQGLEIIQSKKGYTFTMDAILLANLAKAKEGDSVLDLGTGSGIIPILMSAKTAAKRFVGIEIQQRLADMATRSVALNKLEHKIQIINKDMQELKDVLGQSSFDVVISNPPYMVSNDDIEHVKEQDICKREIRITLEKVIKTASQQLRFGGNLFIIVKSDRLTDLIYHMRQYKIEPKLLTPIQPKADKNIDTIIIEGKKGGKSGLIFNKPLLIYNDDNTYTAEVRRIYNK